jgi:GNAT superfamily N-acetyltransferase
MSGSYERMIRLAEESFHAPEDPSVVNVTDELILRLRRMHSATVGEECDESGPIAWVLLLPTTEALIARFLEKEITERQLFAFTPDGIPYGVLYMSSALVLPEHRRRGIAQRLIVEAVTGIRRDHPIGKLAYWPFSLEGKVLAESVARECRLPLYERLR